MGYQRQALALATACLFVGCTSAQSGPGPNCLQGYAFPTTAPVSAAPKGQNFSVLAYHDSQTGGPSYAVVTYLNDTSSQVPIQEVWEFSSESFNDPIPSSLATAGLQTAFRNHAHEIKFDVDGGDVQAIYGISPISYAYIGVPPNFDAWGGFLPYGRNVSTSFAFSSEKVCEDEAMVVGVGFGTSWGLVALGPNGVIAELNYSSTAYIVSVDLSVICNIDGTATILAGVMSSLTNTKDANVTTTVYSHFFNGSKIKELNASPPLPGTQGSVNKFFLTLFAEIGITQPVKLTSTPDSWSYFYAISGPNIYTLDKKTLSVVGSTVNASVWGSSVGPTMMTMSPVLPTDRVGQAYLAVGFLAPTERHQTLPTQAVLRLQGADVVGYATSNRNFTVGSNNIYFSSTIQSINGGSSLIISSSQTVFGLNVTINAPFFAVVRTADWNSCQACRPGWIGDGCRTSCEAVVPPCSAKPYLENNRSYCPNRPTFTHCVPVPKKGQ